MIGDLPVARRAILAGAVLRGPAKDPFKTYRVIVAGEIGRPGRIVPCDWAAYRCGR